MTIERRFAIELLPDIEWGELRRRVLHAEELGFELVTTADQFVDWKNPSVPWFDPWTTMAAWAEVTSTIRMAPYVAQIPMRDPATLARAVVAIDNISGGRVELGLGLGLTVDPGYDMVGAPNWGNRERADRFGEYIRIVDELMTSGTCVFSGEHYRVEAAVVHPTVQQPRPPITVAAMGPRMMRYAAQHAETWNTMSFGSGPAELLADAASLMAKMTAAREELGRDPGTLRHSFLLFDGGARESGGRFFYWESADAFADLAGQVFDLGYDEIGVYYPVDSQRDVFEHVAAEAMPGLRSDR